MPVTLTFQGKDQIKTGCGAFLSLVVRIIVITFSTFMALKMANHELDSYRTTEHTVDFQEVGLQRLDRLGFAIAVGFRQPLPAGASLIALTQTNQTDFAAEQLSVRPCNLTDPAVATMAREASMQGDLDLDSLWCLEPSIELLGNLAAARFKIARLNVLINRDMNPLDMVVVATHRSVDFDIQGSEPFFTQTRVLWEGRVSATEGMILKHRVRLNTVELQDTIWPAFMSATQTIAQAGSTRVGHSSRKNEPFLMTIELDNVRTVSRRTSFSLLWMLASIGGLCFILTFVVRWLLHACARPLHVARLVERMYKRTTDERKSLPLKVIEDDEHAEHRPTSRTSSKAD